MRLIHSTLLAAAPLVALLVPAHAALAQEAEEKPPVIINGLVTLTSDYRFRGVSESNNSFAIQGGLTAGHESGFYAGFWSSSLAGWGTFGGPAGPENLLAGVAFAPKQEALGNWFNHPDSRIGDTEANFYVWGDASFTIPDAPVTLKAHIGYCDGNPGLGPNGTSIAPTGKYWDWLLGADVVVGPVTFGVAYIDTDISRSSAAYQRLHPNVSKVPDGGCIACGRVVILVTGAF